jgi:hypothetical protein
LINTDFPNTYRVKALDKKDCCKPAPADLVLDGQLSLGNPGLEGRSPPSDNGTLAHRAIGLALDHGVSRQWKGDWQRAA